MQYSKWIWQDNFSSFAMVMPLPTTIKLLLLLRSNFMIFSFSVHSVSFKNFHLFNLMMGLMTQQSMNASFIPLFNLFVFFFLLSKFICVIVYPLHSLIWLSYSMYTFALEYEQKLYLNALHAQILCIGNDLGYMHRCEQWSAGRNTCEN